MKTYSRKIRNNKLITLLEPVNLDATCRLCLSSDEDQVNIFSEGSAVASMISYFVSVKVCKGDMLPAQICQPCHRQLRVSHSFYLKCQETEAVLHQLVDSRHIDSSKINCDLTVRGCVEDNLLLIPATEVVGDPGSRDRLADTPKLLNRGKEPVVSAAGNEHGDDICHVERRLQTVDNDCQVLGDAANYTHSIAVNLFEELGSCTAVERGDADEHCKSYSPCVKEGRSASGETPSNSLACGGGSRKLAVSPPQSPRDHETDDVVVIEGEDKDNASSEVSCVLCCVELDTGAVAGEEVTLAELVPEFDDGSEFNSSFGNVVEGNRGSEAVVETEWVDCNRACYCTQDVSCGLYGGECLRNVGRGRRLAQERTVVQTARERGVGKGSISGPIRMELHPACISVCQFKCRLCGEAFAHRSELKQHESIHSRRQGHDCSICFKHFSCKYKLDEHMRIHMGLKPYKCAVCGRSFTQRGTLQNHLKKHSGMRPYVCSECGRGFFNCEGLQVHMRLHRSDPLDFDLNECPLCDKAFVYPSGLSRHLTLHNSHRFTCDHCRKDFRELPTLKRHMRQKHGFG